MEYAIKQLYWNTKNELNKMKKGNMKMADRIAWEKAITNLEAIKVLIDRLTT